MEEEGKQIWLKRLRFHKSSILHVGFKTWVKIRSDFVVIKPNLT